MRKVLSATAVAVALMFGGTAIISAALPEVAAATKAKGKSKPKKSVPKGNHVGSTITLTTLGNQKIAITVSKVYDPATGSDEFNQPDAGKRLVAIEFTIRNASSKSIQGDPDNDVSLVGSNGAGVDVTFSTVSECQGFNSQVDLSAGESQLGCEVFQLPTGIAPKEFKFTPDSGFASSFGEWQIP